MVDLRSLASAQKSSLIDHRTHARPSHQLDAVLTHSKRSDEFCLESLAANVLYGTGFGSKVDLCSTIDGVSAKALNAQPRPSNNFTFAAKIPELWPANRGPVYVSDPASTVAVVRTNFKNGVDASDGLSHVLRTMNQALSLDATPGYDLQRHRPGHAPRAFLGIFLGIFGT